MALLQDIRRERGEIRTQAGTALPPPVSTGSGSKGLFSILAHGAMDTPDGQKVTIPREVLSHQ
jgi:hypothetical protein